MDGILLSIIVATYNADKYLNRFMASLVPQILKAKDAIEIVFVDDCSNDDSVSVIRDYQSKYRFVKLVLHKQNRGAAIARNTGIDNSTGEFLLMADPDDELKPAALSRILPIMRDVKPDIIRYRFERVSPDGRSLGISQELKGSGLYEISGSRESLRIAFLDVAFHMGSAAGAFRRAAAPQTRQKSDNVIAEDLAFGWERFKYAKTVYCIQEPLYTYYQYANSVSHRDRDVDTIKSVIKLNARFWKEAQNYPGFDLIAKEVFNDLFRLTVGWHYELVFKERTDAVELHGVYYTCFASFIKGVGGRAALGLMYPIGLLICMTKSDRILGMFVWLWDLTRRISCKLQRIRKKV